MSCKHAHGSHGDNVFTSVFLRVRLRPVNSQLGARGNYGHSRAPCRLPYHRGIVGPSDTAGPKVASLFPYPISTALVRLSFRTISQKAIQLGSPNLTEKCSTKSPGNLFISSAFISDRSPYFGVKGQRPRSCVAKTLPAWVVALL